MNKVWVRRSLRTTEVSQEELKIQSFLRNVLFALNRITPENYDLIVAVMVALPIYNCDNLIKLCHMIIERAIIEPLYCELYAKLCHSLSEKETESKVAQGLSLASSLLSICKQKFDELLLIQQEEFCKDQSHSQQEVNYFDMMKRRKLFACLEFIGELFNFKVIPDSVIYEVANKLVSSPSYLDFLCILLKTTGENLDSCNKNKQHLDYYIASMEQFLNNSKYLIPSRLKFAFMDLNDLRQNHWIPISVIEKPVSLAEIHNVTTKLS
ncbi:uncharacterized protein LOC100211985 isoform X2 [Hydra vulgaris]|uniref:Uncharacterized protein LOC100211985 isoform X2 n=1 Tax=Hydra vulgaris TaxID=6087 RepID=A0ABM4C0B9_HYDVU